MNIWKSMWQKLGSVPDRIGTTDNSTKNEARNASREEESLPTERPMEVISIKRAKASAAWTWRPRIIKIGASFMRASARIEADSAYLLVGKVWECCEGELWTTAILLASHIKS
jgi:hypothetical protein